MPRKGYRNTTGKTRKKKEGLRKPQINVLLAIGDCRSGIMSKQRLSEILGVTQPVIGMAVGYDDDDKRKKFEENDKIGFKSLLTLGMIERIDLDIDGLLEINYRLTPAGRKELERFIQGKTLNLADIPLSSNDLQPGSAGQGDEK